MKITVIGTGYVGLVTGTCFAEMGNEVWCIDKDQNKINDLKNGKIPIYEKDLNHLISKNYQEGRLHFSTNLKDGFNDSLFILIAVGTPPLEDGSVNLHDVYITAEEIGDNINNYKIILNKSTVPVGTAEEVKKIIKNKLAKRNLHIEFDVVSNPEFLKEGNAVQDFMRPERVIIGTKSEKAAYYLKELYSVFFKQHPRIIHMDECSAEITKYAANAMLATKITFMNEIANLCDAVGADVELVRLGIGSDRRIGYSFIYPGIGYGGSCFPKDVKAIIKIGEAHQNNMNILKAVETVNNKQKEVLFKKIYQHYHSINDSLKGKQIAVWGLAFKPDTDDIREASSLVIIKKLIENGAHIRAHDPEAIPLMKEALKEYAKEIQYFDNNYECLDNCDALALLTEWHIYRQPDFERIKISLKSPLIFDGRNQYDPKMLKLFGFKYYCIGRNAVES